MQTELPKLFNATAPGVQTVARSFFHFQLAELGRRAQTGFFTSSTRRTVSRGVSDASQFRRCARSGARGNPATVLSRRMYQRGSGDITSTTMRISHEELLAGLAGYTAEELAQLAESFDTVDLAALAVAVGEERFFTSPQDETVSPGVSDRQ